MTGDLESNVCAFCDKPIPPSKTVYGQFCKGCADVLAI